MKLFLFASLIALSISPACNSPQSAGISADSDTHSGAFSNCASNQSGTTKEIRTAPYGELEEIIGHFRRHSFKRKMINWDTLLQTIRTAKAMCPEEKLKYLFTLINDNHSVLIDSGKIIAACRENILPEVLLKSWDSIRVNNCGYIRINSVTGENKELLHHYIENINSQFRQYDKKGNRNWVIDLRHNSGGNFWPMFLALYPLLGDGNFGAFENPDGTVNQWLLKAGTVYQDQLPVISVNKNMQLKTSIHKIFILTGAYTASAAEALVIAFKGRANTTVIGLPTYGATSTTITIRLGPERNLVIANGYMLDRCGKRQTGAVIPDIVIADQSRIEATIQSVLSTFNNS